MEKYGVEHAFFSKTVEKEGQQIVFMVNLEKATVSNEQLGKLLNILDETASKAKTTLEW